MTRSSTADQWTAGREQADSADGGGSLAGAVRKAVLILGVFGLAWAVARRVRSSDRSRVSRDAGARPDRDPADVPIDDAAETAASGAGESARPDEDLPGTDRSTEEIEQRAEAHVEETPAEPGEMEVDEDLVEDVVDEDVEAGDESSTDDETA